jgi:tyrosine-protein phosphatase YwqE
LAARDEAQSAATARTFIKQGCVHFIASDAHASNDRIPVLSNAAKEAVRLAGSEEAQNFVAGNPHRAVQGERIKTGEIKDIRPKGRGFLNFIRKYTSR